MKLTRGVTGATVAALAGATFVSTAITLLAVFDGENLDATTSFQGAMQWFGVSLIFSFPLALIIGLVLGLPMYVIARRSLVLSMGKLSVLGISIGAIVGLVIAMVMPGQLFSYAALGALAGFGAAIAWWFLVERRRYPVAPNGN